MSGLNLIKLEVRYYHCDLSATCLVQEIVQILQILQQSLTDWLYITKDHTHIGLGQKIITFFF